MPFDVEHATLEWKLLAKAGKFPEHSGIPAWTRNNDRWFAMTDKPGTRFVSPTIDLSAPGYRSGDLMVRWSDNSVPLGYHPVPIIVAGSGEAPVALLTAGVHGDEFEGPAAIMRIARKLSPEKMKGTVIAIPFLNTPAVNATTRTSPLDGANLNRVFPGCSTGGPTELIADYVESVLVPRCDLVIDLHSGGNASVFTACTLVTRTADRKLLDAGMELARLMGLPTIWMLGGYNDDRSLNSAAARAGVPMVAAELGGGGGCDPEMVTMAETGIMNCLGNAGIAFQQSGPNPSPIKRTVEVLSMESSVYSPGHGMFDRYLQNGSTAQEGQPAGLFCRIDDPARDPELIRFPHSGFVLAHTNRGISRRGDLLYLVATPIGEPV